MSLSSYCVVAIIVLFIGSCVHANEEEEEQAPPPHVPSLEALGGLSSKVDCLMMLVRGTPHWHLKQLKVKILPLFIVQGPNPIWAQLSKE
jgi:hypothetical protein